MLHESGKQKPEKSEGQAGNSRGTLESAAEHALGNAGTSPQHDASLRERREGVSASEKRLGEWAEENGKLGGKLPREDNRGSEHTVELDPAINRVLKATRPDSHEGFGIAYGNHMQGASAGEYLDRLSLQNEIFNDDIRLERVVKAGGRLSVVTSQPYIKGRDATEQEIDELMDGLGFRKLYTGMFYDEGRGIIAYDLVPKNVKIDENGVAHPIDPVIQRVTKAFADDLEKYPIHAPAAASPEKSQTS